MQQINLKTLLREPSSLVRLGLILEYDQDEIAAALMSECGMTETDARAAVTQGVVALAS